MECIEERNPLSNLSFDLIEWKAGLPLFKEMKKALYLLYFLYRKKRFSFVISVHDRLKIEENSYSGKVRKIS